MEHHELETMPQPVIAIHEERDPCSECWMGEYKEVGYRNCNNPKCPVKPGAGN